MVKIDTQTVVGANSNIINNPGYVGYTPAEFRRKEYYQRQHQASIHRQKSRRAENKRSRLPVRLHAIASVSKVEKLAGPMDGSYHVSAVLYDPRHGVNVLKHRQHLWIYSVRHGTTYGVRNLVSHYSRTSNRVELVWKSDVERLTPSGFKSFRHPRYAAKAFDPNDTSLRVCIPSYSRTQDRRFDVHMRGTWVGRNMRVHPKVQWRNWF